MDLPPSISNEATHFTVFQRFRLPPHPIRIRGRQTEAEEVERQRAAKDTWVDKLYDIIYNVVFKMPH